MELGAAQKTSTVEIALWSEKVTWGFPLPSDFLLLPLKLPQLVYVSWGAPPHLGVRAAVWGPVRRDARVRVRVVDGPVLERLSRKSEIRGQKTCRWLAARATDRKRVWMPHVSELPDDKGRLGVSVARAVLHADGSLSLGHLGTKLCRRVETDLLLRCVFKVLVQERSMVKLTVAFALHLNECVFLYHLHSGHQLY